MTSHLEKRRHPRIDKAFFVTIKPYGTKACTTQANTGITINISEGGLLLEMKNNIPQAGSNVTLNICFGNDILKIPSKIRRIKKLDKKRIGIGLQFFNLPDAGINDIRGLQ